MKQPWQEEGLGTDEKALKRVLNAYIGDGIQGVESQMALKSYLTTKLDDIEEMQMYDIDADAMLEMYVECFGARTAFYSISRMLGWITPSAYEETEAKYKERLEKLEKEKDRILSDYTYAANKAESAEERILQLQGELEHCKADLQALRERLGGRPDHERG